MAADLTVLGLQFSSLEPEIVCRLLYVKDVELIPSTAGSSPALSAPPGQTELPACPVCLERLDEHISGIATTVSHTISETAMQQKQYCSCRSKLCLGHGTPLTSGEAHTLLSHAESNTVQVCNHRFHSECLQRWGDMSCPVCRYCSPSSTADSRCSTCSTSQVMQPPICALVQGKDTSVRVGLQPTQCLNADAMAEGSVDVPDMRACRLWTLPEGPCC